MVKGKNPAGDLLTPGGVKDPELRKIQSAWDKNTGGGRDEKARDLAREYVESNRDKFIDIENMTLDECVAAVDALRAAGLETQQWLVETWLLATVPKQYIGGSINHVAGPNDIQGE